MTTPRFDLTGIPIVKKVLVSRWLQWSLTAITLPFFVLAILAGLFGTPAGNRNFGIVFVWIVWWAVLILLLVPFAGRLWCTMCPLPAPGEWLQRRALVQPRSAARLYTLGLKWPRRLRGIWLQNASFLLVALFSAVILTTPAVSALVLLLFVLIAMGTSLIFERRTFCRYLCPVGGFIGLYAQVAPVEIRVKNYDICVAHKEKTCYVGSNAGYGCPWLVFPAALDKNTYCGMCTECLKTCPMDNIGLFARPFAADLMAPKGRLDEAYKAFIMLTCAFIYSLVLLGPWASLKEAAYAVGSASWWLYAVGFLTANLIVTPGLFWLCTAAARRLGRAGQAARQAFIEHSYALIPLGLAAWAAFSLGFVFINLSYAWQVMSDPFGWGWNLFGSANWAWTPYLSGLVPLLQAIILLLGLAGAVSVVLHTARVHGVAYASTAPIIGFCAACTLAMMWLYM